jgi:hypothetical protein
MNQTRVKARRHNITCHIIAELLLSGAYIEYALQRGRPCESLPNKGC